MSQNPLQQYFRQPKIFIKLPSLGTYNRPGIIQGDASSLPVYGMTGMDEILMKTPDALLSGDSTVKVIESCVPSIKDGWDVSSLDLDLLLVSIRIATFGNLMNVTSKCANCSNENEYEIDLSPLVDYYNNFYFNNKLTLPSMIIKVQPLNYRQTTQFSLRNFALQQQLSQLGAIETEEERTNAMNRIFQDLSVIQQEVYVSSIESIEVNNTVVTDKIHIDEFIKNCDSDVINQIKQHIGKNRDALALPPFDVKCDNCGHQNKLAVDLDQSNFFARV